MSKFTDDVKLLADLQTIITEEEKTANPPAYAGDLFGAISPVLKKAMPATIAKAKKHIAVPPPAGGKGGSPGEDRGHARPHHQHRQRPGDHHGRHKTAQEPVQKAFGIFEEGVTA